MFVYTNIIPHHIEFCRKFGLDSCALYLFYVFACYNDGSFVTVSILIERFHDSR